MTKNIEWMVLGCLLSGQVIAADTQPPSFSVSELQVYGVVSDEFDLEQDGDVETNRLGASIEFSMPQVLGWRTGMGLELERRHFDFSNNTLFGVGAEPSLAAWDYRDDVGVSFSLMRRISQRWALIVSPQLEWAASDDSSLSDGFGYGVVVLGQYRVNSDLSLGVGAAYNNDIFEVNTFPFIAVEWQINDKWRLSNPFEAGLSGRAGLALSYRWNPHYEVAFGIAHREDSFAVESGAVEIEAPLSFVRATYFPAEDWRASLLFGRWFDGELQWKPDGASRLEQDIDSRLGAGLLVSWDF